MSIADFILAMFTLQLNIQNLMGESALILVYNTLMGTLTCLSLHMIPLMWTHTLLNPSSFSIYRQFLSREDSFSTPSYYLVYFLFLCVFLNFLFHSPDDWQCTSFIHIILEFTTFVITIPLSSAVFSHCEILLSNTKFIRHPM